jgi:hypothetical protein
MSHDRGERDEGGDSLADIVRALQEQINALEKHLEHTDKTLTKRIGDLEQVLEGREKRVQQALEGREKRVRRQSRADRLTESRGT